MISKGKFQKLPTVGPLTFPYYPLKYGNGMGSLWEGSLTIGDPWKNPVMKLLKKKHVNLGVGNVKKNRNIDQYSKWSSHSCFLAVDTQ